MAGELQPLLHATLPLRAMLTRHLLVLAMIFLLFWNPRAGGDVGKRLGLAIRRWLGY